jgi:hypothetical protein
VAHFCDQDNGHLFYKRRGISWLLERLLASGQGLCYAVTVPVHIL